jgi:hypothetical protein
MSDYYTFLPKQYPALLDRCIDDAELRYNGSGSIIDIRMFIQKWPSTACGFEDAEAVKITTLAPTVIVKFDHKFRYVYHNGRFAYAVNGQTSVQYYDAVRGRKLPGAERKELSYLTA